MTTSEKLAPFAVAALIEVRHAVQFRAELLGSLVDNVGVHFVTGFANAILPIYLANRIQRIGDTVFWCFYMAICMLFEGGLATYRGSLFSLFLFAEISVSLTIILLRNTIRHTRNI